MTTSRPIDSVRSAVVRGLPLPNFNNYWTFPFSTTIKLIPDHSQMTTVRAMRRDRTVETKP